MNPRQFKLIAGKHLHSDGCIYFRGSIILSEIDLVQKFGKGKFQEVGAIVVNANDPSQPPIPDPVKIEIPMGVPKPVVGTPIPVILSPAVSTPAVVVAAPEKPAATVPIPEKPVEKPASDVSAATGTDSVVPDDDIEGIKGKPHPKYGENITHKFPKAQVCQVQVFCDGEKYRIVDPESGRAITKKLSSVKKVERFLEDF